MNPLSDIFPAINSHKMMLIVTPSKYNLNFAQFASQEPNIYTKFQLKNQKGTKFI